jgi:formate--tetrahydrofolate ligase
LDTAAVVLVATIRALKLHGGADKDDLEKPDPEAVEKGLGNLAKQNENIQTFCETPVVALNRFASDKEEEITVVRRACEQLKVPFALSEVFSKGGEGGMELARQVMAHAEASSRPFCPLYQRSEPIKAKIEKIAKHMYGAAEVSYDRRAEKDLKLINRLGYEDLAVCVAKTQKSLSDDPRMVGRPEDFEITVRNVILAAGAGYVVPLLGSILRMPGLPASPKAEKINLSQGRIKGLS